MRQGGFTGAGINAVTKSGTNDFAGTLYYTTRNQGYVGTKTAGLNFNPGTFKFTQPGGSLSGPIIRDRLFFYVDYESDDLTQPATNFVANTGTQPVTGNTTRVLASDLDALSAFLKSKFNYDTGPYQAYNFEVPSKRFIGKLDYNINATNKFTFRYSYLSSQSDNPISNSGSLGNTGGGRSNNSNSMSFQNSTYAILENIKSGVGELNSSIGTNMSNQIIAGYTTNDESRKSHGTFFPLVDILNGPTGGNYVVVRLRAVYAEQHSDVPHGAVPGQLVDVHRQARSDVRRHRTAVRVGQRIFPRAPERLRVQHAGRFLRRREWVPRQRLANDVPRHAEPVPGSLCEHPRPDGAAAAAQGEYLRLRTPRTTGARPAT